MKNETNLKSLCYNKLMITEMKQLKEILNDQTSDNYVFFGFPKEMTEPAKLILNKNKESKSCFITIDAEMEAKLNETLNGFTNDKHKDIICRDLFVTLFMKELTKDSTENQTYQDFLEKGLDMILSGDSQIAKEYHSFCPMPLELTKMIKKNLPMVLNVFLIDAKNVHLQRALNNYIGSREPYSIRVFSTQRKFPSYYDQSGNAIQTIHDFREVLLYKPLEEIQPALN